MPNLVAYGALLLWPLVTLMLVLALPMRRAIVWAVLAGYLFLPVGTEFNFKGIPSLDKTSIPNIAIFVFAMTMARRGDFRWPRGVVINLLLLAYLLCPFLTGIANRDALQFGLAVRPAMSAYDSLSVTGFRMIELMPFILGVGFLRDEGSHREILLVFVTAALIYSLPVLEEVRMSPQLARHIFGINDVTYFIQSVRSGGFRAMVFLGHGLLISAFFALAVFAAVGLWRNRDLVWGMPASIVALYLGVILVLNKSVGAIVMTVLLVPLFMLLPVRRFLGVALVIAGIIFVYPLLRSADVVPTRTIEAAAKTISNDRANSFAFRIANEEVLLERARERPLLGWGTWGRNRILTANYRGEFLDKSVTDGTWIISMGTFGLVGYVAMFGLLTYPVWRTFRMRKRGVTLPTAALIGLLILNLIDLIPNSSLRPITWLIAGALSGLVLAESSQKTRVVARASPYLEHLKTVASST